ncbi:MAG TPA: methionyl-tRNA formyltransferase [Candidatus Binatia bacterium]|jgi:methionyl-tRNA formyltransferase|nr:methionyl-tRNA formyltransferase [Candidatus Binatia bacterium]
MGTPAFACPILEALMARSDPVVGVVCQPDRPQGRGLTVAAPPVKQLALAHGLPVLQPTKVRVPEFADALRALAPDLIVVAAYGRILPRTILDLPPHGCINVHASLLPRHRGAAPIAHAILAGDAVTGVTIMAMAEEMDAGDMLLTRETPIGPDDTTGSLTTRLSALGAEAIGAAIDGLHAGTIHPVPQPPDGITFSPPIEREQGRIDWRRPAGELDRLVRAFTPAPTASTTLLGKVVKVHRAVAGGDPGRAAPGTVVEASPSGILVATGAGALRILELQLEGKRRLDAGAFVAGQRLAPGTCLGDA